MLLGTLSLAVLILAPVVQASTSYLPTWAGVYPSSFSDDNARCRLCHAASTQNLNPYGEALCSSNAGNISNRILAVEAVDSDTDPTGSSNITESNASTQPGWTPGGVNPTYSSSNCSPTGLVEAPSEFISGSMDPAIINQFPWELFMPAIQKGANCTAGPGIPDMLGTYVGTGTITNTNCTDQDINRTFNTSVIIEIFSQEGSNFSGRSTVELVFEGVTFTGGDELDGSVTTEGKISGTTAGTFEETRSTGIFNGQLSGNTLSFDSLSQDTAGETCTTTGSTTAIR